MKIRCPIQTIFTYHEVLPDGPLSRYSVSAGSFETHLELFRELGREFSCSPRISFDDGHGSNYLYAAPLLERFDMLATFFITAGFIANRENFMSWPEVRSLVAAGHAVQAHGWTHRFLTECTDAELAHELIDAKTYLEDRLGQPVTELSLPGGRYDERVLMFVAKAGYRKVYSSDPWLECPVTGSLRLAGRVMVRRDTSAFHLQGLARQTILARNVLHVEHVARKGLLKLLGHDKYHALWSRASGRQHQAAPNTEEYMSSRR